MIEFPEFSRRGWLRLGFIVLASCVAQVLSSYAFSLTLDLTRYRSSINFSVASMVVSFLPLLAVLTWKGELSFFDSLKDRGSVKGWRLWLIPGIPAFATGIVSLIEYPKGYTLLFNQFKSLGIDTVGLCVIGLSLMSAVCLTPTLVKWLGDHSDWKWFIGLLVGVSAAPALVELLVGVYLRSSSEMESSRLLQAPPASIMFSVVGSALSVVAFLLLMLWSKGDIRAAIAASVWGVIFRFVGPTHVSIPGAVSGVVGVLLLWLAVGGLKQLQTRRQMVAQGETPEV